MNNTLFVTAGEIAEELGISKPFAYKLVRQMNEELDAKGFLTIAVRFLRCWKIIIISIYFCILRQEMYQWPRRVQL